MAAHADLSDLFQSLFELPEARALLLDTFGENVANAVHWNQPWAYAATDLVAVLGRRGLIGSQLFAHLVRARPSRRADIQAVMATLEASRALATSRPPAAAAGVVDRGPGLMGVGAAARGALVGIGAPRGRGTGFFVRRDVLATALHVVAEPVPGAGAKPTLYDGITLAAAAPGGERVPKPYAVAPLSWSWSQDWILLTVKDPPEVHALQHGAPAEGHLPIRFQDVATPEGDERRGTLDSAGVARQGEQLIPLRAADPAAGPPRHRSGCSGAPAMVDGRVAGIVVMRDEPYFCEHAGRLGIAAGDGDVFVVPIAAVTFADGTPACWFDDGMLRDARARAREAIEELLSEEIKQAGRLCQWLGAPVAEEHQVAEAGRRLVEQGRAMDEILAVLAKLRRKAAFSLVRDLLVIALPLCADYAGVLEQARAQLRAHRTAIIRFPTRSSLHVEVMKAHIEGRAARMAWSEQARDVVYDAQINLLKSAYPSASREEAEAVFHTIMIVLGHELKVHVPDVYCDEVRAAAFEVEEALADRLKEADELPPYYALIPNNAEGSLKLVREYLPSLHITTMDTSQPLPAAKFNQKILALLK